MKAACPYCPIPQNHEQYVHVIYPTSSGYILDNGVVRAMTDEELEPLDEAMQSHLAGSFR